MKFTKTLKVYGDFDRSQVCGAPFYGKDSVNNAREARKGYMELEVTQE